MRAVSILHQAGCDGVLVTDIGQAELTVRPEPSVTPGEPTVILVRIESPMLDALSAAYLSPIEALELAETLRGAAERADRRPSGPRATAGGRAVPAERV